MTKDAIETWSMLVFLLLMSALFMAIALPMMSEEEERQGSIIVVQQGIGGDTDVPNSYGY